MSEIPLPTNIELPEMPNGWHRMYFQCLSNGSLALLGANVDLNEAWRTDNEGSTDGVFHRLLPDALGKIWIVENGALAEQSLPLIPYPFPMIDQFSDGRWLLVSSRSDGKGNARIFNRNGELLTRIELGDGISHVQIDDQDRIWVGWFDEGVFGNDEWRFPGLEWPPSSAGVAAFNAGGQLLSMAKIKGIAGCYAMNVFADEVWTCTYTDFPIWRSKDGTEITWDTNLSGTKAIAVANSNIIAAGGYGDEAGNLALLKLHSRENAETLATWDLMKSDFFEGEIEWLSGRSDKLYAYDGNSLLMWSVAQFL